MNQELWEKAAAFHGHKCPGLAIGFKAWSFPELMIVIAVPTLNASTMVRIKSVYFLKYVLRNSIRAPQIDVKMNAPRTGL